MKINSLKAKIATGAIAASLLATTGMAFANTNAGTQFRAWGDSQIAAAKAAITQKNSNETTAAVNKFNTDSATKRDNSKAAIDQAGTDEKLDTETKIKGKLAEHVNSLQSALDNYKATIGGDFDGFVIIEKGKIAPPLNAALDTLKTNITSVLNQAKAANVKDVTEQSLLVKGKATSDLIQKINQVKADLAALLATEKAAAEGELAAHLTSEVNRVNEEIDTLISGLQTAAEGEIAAAGKAVEDSAIANFERVIGIINQNDPIKVDKQKLKWEASAQGDGKIHFKVENKNEFDVVFKYKFTGVSTTSNGVTETPFGQSSAKPGVTEFIFYEVDNRPADRKLEIEWMDHNGVWQKEDVKGNF